MDPKGIASHPLVCTVCKQRFWMTSKYLDHMNTHKHLLLSCNICNKSYYDQKLLDQHYLVHNEVIKTYDCNKCPRQFFHQHQLEKHKHFHLSNEISLAECKKKTAFNSSGETLDDSIETSKNNETLVFQSEEDSEKSQCIINEFCGLYEDVVNVQNDENIICDYFANEVIITEEVGTDDLTIENSIVEALDIKSDTEGIAIDGPEDSLCPKKGDDPTVLHKFEMQDTSRKKFQNDKSGSGRFLSSKDNCLMEEDNAHDQVKSKFVQRDTIKNSSTGETTFNKPVIGQSKKKGVIGYKQISNTFISEDTGDEEFQSENDDNSEVSDSSDEDYIPEVKKCRKNLTVKERKKNKDNLRKKPDCMSDDDCKNPKASNEKYISEVKKKRKQTSKKTKYVGGREKNKNNLEEKSDGLSDDRKTPKTSDDEYIPEVKKKKGKQTSKKNKSVVGKGKNDLKETGGTSDGDCEAMKTSDEEYMPEVEKKRKTSKKTKKLVGKEKNDLEETGGTSDGDCEAVKTSDEEYMPEVKKKRKTSKKTKKLFRRGKNKGNLEEESDGMSVDDCETPKTSDEEYIPEVKKKRKQTSRKTKKVDGSEKIKDNSEESGGTTDDDSETSKTSDEEYMSDVKKRKKQSSKKTKQILEIKKNKKIKLDGKSDSTKNKSSQSTTVSASMTIASPAEVSQSSQNINNESASHTVENISHEVSSHQSSGGLNSVAKEVSHDPKKLSSEKRKTTMSAEEKARRLRQPAQHNFKFEMSEALLLNRRRNKVTLEKKRVTLSAAEKARRLRKHVPLDFKFEMSEELLAERRKNKISFNIHRKLFNQSENKNLVPNNIRLPAVSPARTPLLSTLETGESSTQNASKLQPVSSEKKSSLTHESVNTNKNRTQNSSKTLPVSNQNAVSITTFTLPTDKNVSSFYTPQVNKKFLYVGPEQSYTKVQSIIDELENMPHTQFGSKTSTVIPDHKGILEKKVVKDFIFVKVTPEYMAEMEKKTSQSNLSLKPPEQMINAGPQNTSSLSSRICSEASPLTVEPNNNKNKDTELATNILHGFSEYGIANSTDFETSLNNKQLISCESIDSVPVSDKVECINSSHHLSNHDYHSDAVFAFNSTSSSDIADILRDETSPDQFEAQSMSTSYNPKNTIKNSTAFIDGAKKSPLEMSKLVMPQASSKQFGAKSLNINTSKCNNAVEIVKTVQSQTNVPSSSCSVKEINKNSTTSAETANILPVKISNSQLQTDIPISSSIINIDLLNSVVDAKNFSTEIVKSSQLQNNSHNNVFTKQDKDSTNLTDNTKNLPLEISKLGCSETYLQNNSCSVGTSISEGVIASVKLVSKVQDPIIQTSVSNDIFTPDKFVVSIPPEGSVQQSRDLGSAAHVDSCNVSVKKSTMPNFDHSGTAEIQANKTANILVCAKALGGCTMSANSCNDFMEKSTVDIAHSPDRSSVSNEVSTSNDASICKLADFETISETDVKDVLDSVISKVVSEDSTPVKSTSTSYLDSSIPSDHSHKKSGLVNIGIDFESSDTESGSEFVDNPVYESSSEASDVESTKCSPLNVFDKNIESDVMNVISSMITKVLNVEVVQEGSEKMLINSCKNVNIQSKSFVKADTSHTSNYTICPKINEVSKSNRYQKSGSTVVPKVEVSLITQKVFNLKDTETKNTLNKNLVISKSNKRINVNDKNVPVCLQTYKTPIPKITETTIVKKSSHLTDKTQKMENICRTKCNKTIVLNTSNTVKAQNVKDLVNLDKKIQALKEIVSSNTCIRDIDMPKHTKIIVNRIDRNSLVACAVKPFDSKCTRTQHTQNKDVIISNLNKNNQAEVKIVSSACSTLKTDTSNITKSNFIQSNKRSSIAGTLTIKKTLDPNNTINQFQDQVNFDSQKCHRFYRKNVPDQTVKCFSGLGSAKKLSISSVGCNVQTQSKVSMKNCNNTNLSFSSSPQKSDLLFTNQNLCKDTVNQLLSHNIPVTEQSNINSNSVAVTSAFNSNFISSFQDTTSGFGGNSVPVAQLNPNITVNPSITMPNMENLMMIPIIPAGTTPVNLNQQPQFCGDVYLPFNPVNQTPLPLCVPSTNFLIDTKSIPNMCTTNSFSGKNYTLTTNNDVSAPIPSFSVEISPPASKRIPGCDQVNSNDSDIIMEDLISYESDYSISDVHITDVRSVEKQHPHLKLTPKVLKLYKAKLEEKERKKREKYEMKKKLRYLEKLFSKDVTTNSASSKLKSSSEMSNEVLMNNLVFLNSIAGRSHNQPKADKNLRKTCLGKKKKELSINSEVDIEYPHPSISCQSYGGKTSSFIPNLDTEEKEALKTVEDICSRFKKTLNDDDCLIYLDELDSLITSFNLWKKCQFVFKVLRFCRLNMEKYEVKEKAIYLHKKITEAIKRQPTM